MLFPSPKLTSKVGVPPKDGANAYGYLHTSIA